MNKLVVKKEFVIKVVLISIAVLSLTFLRPMLIFIYPALFIFFTLGLRFKVTTAQLFVFSFAVIISFISMLYEGFFLLNYFTSLYLILTPLFILTLKPPVINKKNDYNYFDSFFKIFAKVLFVVNISAFIYAIIVLSSARYPDDVFTGLYGKSGFGSHSLSLINTAVSIYYLFIKDIKRFVFFFICGVLGFYGLGLIIMVVSACIFSIPYVVKSLGLLIKGIAISSLLVFIMYSVNPKNIDYIVLNVTDALKVFTDYSYDEEMDKVNNYKRTYVPRFITFVDGTRKLFFSDTKVFLFGASPGTYNSRTAFYLNGDFLQSKFVKKYFSENTTYHEKYVKPLLNRKLITLVRWNDGTRNQPFSSIISILVEYGFVISIGLIFIVYSSVRKIIKSTKDDPKKKYVKFLVIYVLLLLLVQNSLEYPEIILFFLIVFKLIHLDNAKREFITT